MAWDTVYSVHMTTFKLHEISVDLPPIALSNLTLTLWHVQDGVCSSFLGPVVKVSWQTKSQKLGQICRVVYQRRLTTAPRLVYKASVAAL